MAKTGESQTGSVSFLSSRKKESWSILENSTFKFESFLEIFCFNSALFIHSPCQTVFSPCQAGNTCYTSTCFSNMCTIYNIINTICALI